jgi:uncharacterized protein CbrC (UPF0167 family)
MLLELVRTPGYISWQGEQWLFHCSQLMCYLGPWGQDAFNAAADDGDGAAFAATVTALPDSAWNALEPAAGAGSVMVYVFKCEVCGDIRGHWDCD